MIKKRGSRKYTIGALIWGVLVLVATLVPGRDPETMDTARKYGIDKIGHFILFAVLTFLVIKMYEERSLKVNFWMTSFALITLGVLTELAQNHIANRVMDTYDLAANILGIVVIVFLVKRK